MHLGKRFATLILTCGLGAGLVGCGFHLKGTNPTAYPLIWQQKRQKSSNRYTTSFEAAST